MSVKISRLIGKRIADRYCITGEIGAGGMGRVFRAISFDDPSQDVAIKVILRDRRLNSEDLLLFQKEAALMSRLHHPNIICFHELGLLEGEESSRKSLGSGYYIVMEIANGLNLKESLAKEGRKDLAFFFQVGMQVTEALDYTHGKNIIHRDIKPQNIIVGKAWQDQRGVLVKVLDFGVARLAEAMHFSAGSEVGGFEDIAGTPLYMAPEQTRLMDAPKDHRVDLYSLGCVLYEILTGRPPFTGKTRDKLARQHVQEEPEMLRSLRPDVPPIIENIVHKLLAKHPDDRYQSAFALMSDLQRAKRRLERREKSARVTFPLALNDRFHAVSAILPLVGRDKEMEILEEEYTQVTKSTSRSRLTVVQGEAGTGKTRLMREFRRFLSRRKVRFVSANFSEHENSLQFNALANGFNDYLNRIRKSQPYEAEELRRKIRALLGPTAHQVAAIVPGLEHFLTDIPKPETDQHNFQTFAKAFSDFTRCLAIDNNPVVFIFDDLQWADDKSLELIDQFFSHNNSQRFFMLVTHRSVSSNENPRFLQFLMKFQKLRRRYREIELGHFSRDNIKEITRLMLNTEQEIGEDFLNYVEEYTRYNPMHVVDCIRTMVARNLLYLRGKDEDWEYDMDVINKSALPIQTIDLVLSRLNRYSQSDINLLEIASVIGLAFQFELLLVQGKSESLAVSRSLTKLIEEGLITRIVDDPLLKHLGKTYTFSHWRIRDEIYKNIPQQRRGQLHLLVAQRVIESVPNPSDKIVFSLAHHVNRAIVDLPTVDAELMQLVVDFNRKAGFAAWNAEAHASAQRYFENAYQMCEKYGQEVATTDETYQLLESIADLSALQRENGVALRLYRELLNKNIKPSDFAHIASKTVSIQIVGGLIGEPMKLVKSSLKRFGINPRKISYWQLIPIFFGLLRDVFPRNFRKHRLYRLLKESYHHRKMSSDARKQATSILELYNQFTLLNARDNPRAMLFRHEEALQILQDVKVDSHIAIRVVLVRACIIARMGFMRLAYQLFNLLSSLSRSMKFWSTTGVIHLYRALFLDYVKSRSDEVKDNLGIAFKYISQDEDRIWYCQAVVFKMYRELMKGRLKNVESMAKKIPETIPTRNWLSPRAMSIYFYVLLLKGDRDKIVDMGETYLNRRQHVRARSQDIFVKTIEIMVSFAKGEVSNTRGFYAFVVEYFVNNLNRELLFPYEEDYISLFVYSFPVLFEQEYGRRLMRDTEMEMILKHLHSRIRWIWGKKRSIPCLAFARSHELLGKSVRKIKPYYDLSLEKSKADGGYLVQLFAYLWFGDYLYRNGAINRKDYLRRAHKLAFQIRAKALVEYSEKLMERRGIAFKPLLVVEPSDEKTPVKARQVSGLVLEHLMHISEVARLDVALEQNLEESLAILNRQYPSHRSLVFLSDSNNQVHIVRGAESVSNEAEMIDYLSPYVHIRSTLFLPVSDAPWATVSSSQSYYGDTTHERTQRGQSVVNQSEDLNQTIAVGGVTGGDDHNVTLPVGDSDVQGSFTRFEKTHITGTNIGNTTFGDGHAGGTALGSRPSSALQMSALIPIICNGTVAGIIFLENVTLRDKDTTQSRFELDQFGNQLGLVFDLKGRDDLLPKGIHLTGHKPMAETLMHSPGEYRIEDCNWLNIWNFGRLRKDRETCWYLGFNLSDDQYMVVYCRLNGTQEKRDRLSSVLWYHMHSVRSFSRLSGQANADPQELFEELSDLLKSVRETSTLESLSLSFTIFNRSTRMSNSGHYGPSRPVVLNQENKVSPRNEVVMTLSNGRDIRYWSVSAYMGSTSLYILTHDSSKLDATLNETALKTMQSSMAHTKDKSEMHRYLQKLIHAENIPRYYLAAFMIEQANQNDDEEFIDIKKAQ